MNSDLILFKKYKTLKKGQFEIFKLFSQAVEDKRVVDRSEIFNIYKEHVATGYSYSYIYKTKIYEKSPWKEWEWSRNFGHWFTNTLGSLVMKGYLRILPAIDFKEVEGVITHGNS